MWQSASTLARPLGRPPGRRTRTRSNSAVDIKKLNARLEQWAGEIANKFKFKKGHRGAHEHPPLEILHSVFVAPEGYRSYVAAVDPPASTAGVLADAAPATEAAAASAALTREQFDEIVESVRSAIGKGIDPKLIKQGSSGSYFMRNDQGKIVAVFKPKDEEPYGLHSSLAVFYFLFSLARNAHRAKRGWLLQIWKAEPENHEGKLLLYSTTHMLGSCLITWASKLTCSVATSHPVGFSSSLCSTLTSAFANCSAPPGFRVFSAGHGNLLFIILVFDALANVDESAA